MMTRGSEGVRWVLGVLVVLGVVLAGLPREAQAAPKKMTFDLIRFAPPAPWNKIAWTKELSADKNQLGYTVVDQKAGTFCRIFVVKSTTSAGALDEDFASEWKALIADNREMLTGPQVTDAAAEDGWQVKAGVGTFAFNGGVSIAMLTSVSGHGRVASVVVMTSSEAYLPAVQAFLGSIEMVRPPAVAKVAATPATGGAAKPQALQGYMEYNPFTKSWTWKLRYPPPTK